MIDCERVTVTVDRLVNKDAGFSILVVTATERRIELEDE